jgi:hypothetical protein
MSSPFQKSFIAKSPIDMHEGKEHVDPDAPGTPGQPGYEPPVLKYKKGDLMSEDDALELTNLNVHDLSEIKKDERSQYMVTTDNDTIRPRFKSPKFFKSEITNIPTKK